MKFFTRFSVKISIVGIIGIIFLLIIMFCGMRYYNLEQKKSAIRQIENRVRQIDRLTNNLEAIKKLEKLSSFTKERLGSSYSELEYRILIRKWWHAQELLHQFLSAKENKFLKHVAPNMELKIMEYSYKLKEDCTKALKELNINKSDLSWKIYNLRGCISVFLAYMMVEFDKDSKKGEKLLKEAISNFKDSIRIVDHIDYSLYDRILPRWNLELISGRGRLSKITRAQKRDVEKMLKEMEVIKPDEIGGFAPGVPLEKKVKK